MSFLRYSRVMDYIGKRNFGDKDSVILITGYEGNGKSAFASHISYRLHRPRSGERYTPDKTIFYNPNVWWDQIEDEEWYKALWLDEAMDLFLSYEWGSKRSKSILKEIAYCRYKRKYIILCLPNIGWCNKYLRDHRIWFWFHVLKRGIVKFRIRREHEIEPDELWKKWTVVGLLPYDDFPYKAKVPYQIRKREEKSEFLKHGGEITIEGIVTMLNDGVFSTVVNRDMVQTQVEDRIHMVLRLFELRLQNLYAVFLLQEEKCFKQK